MKKGMAFLGKGWIFILGVLLMTLNCGGMHQAEYGSKINMPEDSTVTSSIDVEVIINAVVADKDDNPLNDVDVDFSVCCDGGEIIDSSGGSLGNFLSIQTDKTGVATIHVLVYGNYTGQVLVTADIGTVTEQTKITKAIPTS